MTLNKSWKLFVISINRFGYIFSQRKKEWFLRHKLKFSNSYIFTTWWCKPLIFQTWIIWSNRIQSLKYLRSKTLSCKDIEIRKFEFVVKTEFLCTLIEIWTLKQDIFRSELKMKTCKIYHFYAFLSGGTWLKFGRGLEMLLNELQEPEEL